MNRFGFEKFQDRFASALLAWVVWCVVPAAVAAWLWLRWADRL